MKVLDEPVAILVAKHPLSRAISCVVQSLSTQLYGNAENETLKNSTKNQKEVFRSMITSGLYTEFVLTNKIQFRSFSLNFLDLFLFLGAKKQLSKVHGSAKVPFTLHYNTTCYFSLFKYNTTC